LAERYWEMGPGHTRALLAEYFEQQTRRGTLRLQDPEQAAYCKACLVCARRQDLKRSGRTYGPPSPGSWTAAEQTRDELKCW
jgi:AefR-like transcriptional repressor, C-terminal domain